MKLLFSLTVMMLLSSTSYSFDFDSCLVAHYPFSGDALDETGNGADGTVYGATLTADRFGNANMAYEFNGSSDYINTFTSFDFEYRTMSLWAYSHNNSGNGIAEKHVAGHDDPSHLYGQLKVKFSNGNMEARAGGEASNFTYSSVSENTWHHIVVVRDGSTTYYYVDNNLVGTGTSGTAASGANPNPDFVIGTGRELINQFFDGVIDDIRIYNCALGANEISQLYNDPNPAGGCLIADYPFNGNANDETGNGADGTVFGATLTADRFGNPNMAYEFNGTSDYINTFTSFDYEFRTMSLWAYSHDNSGNGIAEKHVAGHDDPSHLYGQLKVKFSNGDMEARAGGEASNFTYSSVSENTWHHIVVVRDGSTTYYYVDNNLVGTGTSGTAASGANPNPDFVIGTGRELINQFFDGVIDDIKIYDCALGAFEVDQLYNSPNPLSVDKEFDFGLNIYPNPGNGVISIDSKQSFNSVMVYNVVGELVYSENYQSNHSEINIEGFANGIYVIKVLDDQGRSNQLRYIKQ